MAADAEEPWVSEDEEVAADEDEDEIVEDNGGEDVSEGADALSSREANVHFTHAAIKNRSSAARPSSRSLAVEVTSDKTFVCVKCGEKSLEVSIGTESHWHGAWLDLKEYLLLHTFRHAFDSFRLLELCKS